MKIQTITSRDNALMKMVKRLAHTNTRYKEEERIWIEGEHLCDAFLKAQHTTRLQLEKVIMALSAKPYGMDLLEASSLKALMDKGCEVVVVPDLLFEHLSQLPSSGGIGFVLSLPTQANAIEPAAHTLVLDRVQDAGNAGSMLRSAAAFGVSQVLALKGTAALWSPKVVRAAMGAHFSLRIMEDLNVSDIELRVPMLATDVHAGQLLHELQAVHSIPHPCAWIMGHEGQGVCASLLDKASTKVQIAQVGQESLNVAAAAAICLYASSVPKSKANR